LVARIITELQANPEAQRLLLRAMLTNSFLGMPARLDHIEQDVAELKTDVAELKTDVAELKTDVAELKTDVAELKTDVAELKTDVAELKIDVAEIKRNVAYLMGSDLENRLHRKARPLLSQKLGLRQTVIMQSQLLEPLPELAGAVNDALDTGVISSDQDRRITETDLILRAQRSYDRSAVWVSVEISNKVDAHDIQRSRETADALTAIFGVATIATVAGYQIDPPDEERAKDLSVECIQITPDVPYAPGQ
jgi:outer membrane murein-binding lipoprotein Lpp